jgi:serine protease Do
MERIAMYSILSRGAVAAILLSGTTIGAGGQQIVAPVRVRDSVIIRQIGPGGGRIDSVMYLFGALQHESPGSPEWLTLKSKIDSLLTGVARRMAGPPDALPKGWIGINAGGVPRRERITDAGDVIRYMVYPEVVSVDPESPASRAGIAPGDLVVAYNGIDLVGHDVNLTQLFVPEKRMSITVRRDGEMKDFTVQIAKVPEHVMQRRMDFDGVMIARTPQPGQGGEFRFERIDPRPTPPGSPAMSVMPDEVMANKLSTGRMFVFAPDGIFGARVSPVTPELARALKLETGVLINDVGDESPAGKSGLKAGDVIVGAEGQTLSTLSGLQRIIFAHMSAHAVDLQVIRDKKSRKITVKW